MYFAVTVLFPKKHVMFLFFSYLFPQILTSVPPLTGPFKGNASIIYGGL